MIIQRLQEKLKIQTRENPAFVRTLLKEALQDYVLRFIYTTLPYINLIFTGGTCLRKIYGLPRFSEDLDFDYEKELDIVRFGKDIETYFRRELQYSEMEAKINNNQSSIFLKFPILKDLGLVQNRSDSQVLFLRCDFSVVQYPDTVKIDTHTLHTEEFSFYVQSYDLPTLFTNKIIAFLQRSFYKGKNQEFPVKGRDLFDLIWLLERSKYNRIQPNWKRLLTILKLNKKEDLIHALTEKTQKINPEDIKKDLIPFIKSAEELNDFMKHYNDVFTGSIQYLQQ